MTARGPDAGVDPRSDPPPAPVPAPDAVPAATPDAVPEPAPPGRLLAGRLLGGPRRWRRREAARSVGISLLSARKLWRALGFAQVTDAEVAFTDDDIAALDTLVGMVRAGLLDEPTTIVLARALAQTTQRLVSWQTEALVDHLGGGDPGSGAEVELLGRLAGDLERLLVYSWRRQVALAAQQLDRTAGAEASSALTVGFADLVSFTRLSQRLDAQRLGALVQRFEGLAADVVTLGGGRVVKTIGDEVLFTADRPAAGVLIALSLSEQLAVDELVPDVRVGLVHGPVLRSLGDVYGPTVNLASRLTALAQPGTVVTDPATAALLAHDSDLIFVPQRQRQVRGFGLLQPLLVARAGIDAPSIDLD